MLVHYSQILVQSKNDVKNSKWHCDGNPTKFNILWFKRYQGW